MITNTRLDELAAMLTDSVAITDGYIEAGFDEWEALIEQCREANRDRQDAMRYRWLCDHYKSVTICDGVEPVIVETWKRDTIGTDDFLDTMIDAALKGPTP